MQGLTPFEQTAVYSVLGIAVLGLLYAVFLRAQTLREPKGTARMLEVWNAIREGADSYLRRQLRSILPLIIVLTAALFLSVYIVPPSPRRSFGDALRIAYRAGTITGMLTDGLGLFGGTIIFIIFGIAAPDALLGFGFGGTLVALFMRVGGGIFTKAADVGADLVGKVEAGIPEDDPRNPAVIADLVGDNVGDCAGMAADIF